MFKRMAKPIIEKENTRERTMIKMKAQELAKYLAYADLDEDFVVVKKTTYLKMCEIIKKYKKIKKILDK
jgi:hypothetical protein